MSSSSGPRRTEFPVAPCERGVDRNMQAINLEAKLEAKLRAVLFAGTAFAILVKRGRFRKKVLANRENFLYNEKPCLCYKIDCKERDV